MPLLIPVMTVRVNGVVVGDAIADDFFSKYGNCGGQNMVGLVAEAHLVRRLRGMGFDATLSLSHNVEIRRITRQCFDYDCVGNYGEVLERMPSELKAEIEEMCEKGVDIRIEDDGEVPVYLEDRLLFRTSFKRILLRIFSECGKMRFPLLMLFDPEFEPFLAAISYELYLLLEYGSNISISGLPPDGVESALDRFEGMLAARGIRLERDFWRGLKISNEDEVIALWFNSVGKRDV